jgi:hypothetical protein
LSAVENPAWPGIEQAVARAGVPVRVLPVSRSQGAEVLFRLQVSAASALGALALNCGGLLLDHGWLRLLGGGADALPDLAQGNGLGDPLQTRSAPPWLLVAFDVLGGQFAVDGGGLGIGAGEVCYRGPDTLRWVGLGAGHGSFVAAALSGALTDFYRSLRWAGWEREVAEVGLGEGLSLYPPPFSAEGADIAAVSRSPVPFSELLGFYEAAAAELGEAVDGSGFQVRFE